MKIPLLITIFSLSCFEAAIPDVKKHSALQTLKEKALYFSSGVVLESGALLAQLGWEICLISPWASTLGNECLLTSYILDKAAKRAFQRSFESFTSNLHQPSQYSWYLNQRLLSQIPTSSKEEEELLLFLEKHWLAKSSGFYSFLVDQVCPCYGISFQVHPETTGFYARNPGLKFPEAYKRRVTAWKDSLPQPKEFPLILTRPFELKKYLPSYFEIAHDEDLVAAAKRIALTAETHEKAKVILDVTAIFNEEDKEQQSWLHTWNTYQSKLSNIFENPLIYPQQIVCIQRVQQEGIGGLRLLPLASISSKEIEEQHQYLLQWVSLFGLSANRIELDRWPLSFKRQESEVPFTMKFPSCDEFASYLDDFEKNWKSDHPQKTLMVNGTLEALKGLLAHVSKDKWENIYHSPTRSALVGLSFFKIQEQLKLLLQEKNDAFFTTASQIELIHSDLSALLEAFSPFDYENFSVIYQELLTTIPKDLKPLTYCGIHSSGMTSLIGIFTAVEKTLGKSPRILYGENSYFENIHAAEQIAHASPIENATEQDWKEVDLILAQFNPALKRINFKVTEYRVEKTAEVLRKALAPGRDKPLTVAIDSTFDFIDSPRIGDLLAEFQEEIEKGLLNVISYKSGLKFDLFGMDNYCGAPFFMVHNQESKWASFDSLLSDEVLQTDRLSLNWFCLAYKSVAPELELYRKQIFDNTRALLNKAPARLIEDKSADYRIIPMESEADIVFIDMKVFGHLHQLRASILVGGIFTINCMENGHPIFYRPSVGFYHPNFTIIYGDECTTIRLTLGLDPAQVNVLNQCLSMIDTLNGSPAKHLIGNWQYDSFRQNNSRLFKLWKD